MSIPLSGLLIKGRMVVDGMIHDHGVLFERAFPLEESRERALAEDAVLAWECYPPVDYNTDGSTWFTPVDGWRVDLKTYAGRRWIEDPASAEQVRRETRKWQKKFLVDAGDKLITGKVYYMVRADGGSLHNCVIGKLIGRCSTIKGCSIGVCNADIKSITDSTVMRLAGDVEEIYNSRICSMYFPSVDLVESSVLSVPEGVIRRVRNSVMHGVPATSSPPENCVVVEW